MDTFLTSTPARQAALRVLAAVGFIAIIGGSMWLAAYSARYVPGVVGRIGGAAVYLGSVFLPAEEPSLSVVPTPVASTTIPFGDAPAGDITLPVASSAPKQAQPTAGSKTSGTYQIGGPATPASAALSGLPDLTVTINAVGYLATSSAESFVASSTVPSQSRPAVRFTIKNIGTNKSGEWRFSASIPAQTSYTFQSQPQQSLNPGDSIEYTLGFDQANRGSGQTILITANSDRTVAESSTSNNSASANITILGG